MGLELASIYSLSHKLLDLMVSLDLLEKVQPDKMDEFALQRIAPSRRALMTRLNKRRDELVRALGHNAPVRLFSSSGATAPDVVAQFAARLMGSLALDDSATLRADLALLRDGLERARSALQVDEARLGAGFEFSYPDEVTRAEIQGIWGISYSRARARNTDLKPIGKRSRRDIYKFDDVVRVFGPPPSTP